jgi:hypothetical protein
LSLAFIIARVARDVRVRPTCHMGEHYEIIDYEKSRAALVALDAADRIFDVS